MVPLQKLGHPTKPMGPLLDDGLKRVKIIAFAGLGAGYGCLVCDGIVGVFLDEKEALKFLGVSVFLLVASLIWLDPIIESVYATYGVQSREKVKGWRGVRVAVIATLLFIFLHKTLDSELSKERNWVVAVPLMAFWALYAGLITWAWVRGARLRPSRAGRYGTWAGTFVALVFTGILFKGGRPSVTGLNYRFAILSLTVIVVVSAWPIVLGYAGGWAIDKSGGANIGRRILYALVICSLGLTVITLAHWFLLSFYVRSYVLANTIRLGLSLTLSVGAVVGWGLGLRIHSEACNGLMAGCSDSAVTRPPKTATDGAASS
jgi:hypothetical protein